MPSGLEDEAKLFPRATDAMSLSLGMSLSLEMLGSLRISLSLDLPMSQDPCSFIEKPSSGAIWIGEKIPISVLDGKVGTEFDSAGQNVVVQFLPGEEDPDFRRVN